jgi:hypothetical protein
MQGLIEAKSKFGLMFDKVWYNKGNNESINLDNFKKGDEVKYEINGKFLKSVEMVAVGAGVAHVQSNKSYENGNADLQGRIARGNACNAVFGSASIAQSTKDMDKSEAFGFLMSCVEKTASYINSGKWEIQ